MPVSLNPNTYVSGGLLNDADAEIVSARFAIYDYQGSITDPEQMPCAVKLELKTTDGEEHVEYLSFGRSVDWVIDDSGKTVEAVAGKKPNNNSVWALFVSSLIDAGFDPALLDSGDVSVLDGIKAHFIRKAAPASWKNLAGQKRDREKTYLVVEKILSMPGQKKAVQAASGDDEMVAALDEFLAQVLPADGKPMKVKSVQIELIRRKDMDSGAKKRLSEMLAKGGAKSSSIAAVSGDEIRLLVE